MTRPLIAGVACLLLIAAPARATTIAAPLLFVQSWSDTRQISVDDDWSGVAGVVGYRGDGLVAEPGSDPRTVIADGSGTPLDVAANRTDPRAVGLAAGVAEFELPNPVVAIQGSATASAPHLVMSFDTRVRAGVTLRLALRDIDATAGDAVAPVAVQYRVGASGAFAALPGGYVADATSGPSAATKVTPLSVVLPAAADEQPLVQVRVITTNSVGQDEWIGVDDIEVTAASATGGGAGPCPEPSPAPSPNPAPGPAPAPGPVPAPTRPPELTDLELSPTTFAPARRGPAVVHHGRTGAALRFRLSRAALVRFEVIRTVGVPGDPRLKPERLASLLNVRGAQSASGTPRFASGGRFVVPGRLGLNRLRFSGRVRGRPLAPGAYVLRAVAVDHAGRTSAPTAVSFGIAHREN